MSPQSHHIQLSPSQAFFFFILFALISGTLISLSQRNWKKLVRAFGSSMKVHWNQKDNATIQINSRKYRAVVLVSERGLSLSQYGLIPKLFLNGQAFIPWSACTSFSKGNVNVLGMSFTQFFIDVNANGEKLCITLPSNIGVSIVEKGYLKI